MTNGKHQWTTTILTPIEATMADIKSLKKKKRTKTQVHSMGSLIWQILSFFTSHRESEAVHNHIGCKI